MDERLSKDHMHCSFMDPTCLFIPSVTNNNVLLIKIFVPEY